MENENWKEDDTFLARWIADEVSPAEKEAFEATEEGQYFVSMKKASENLKAPSYDLEGEWSKLKTTNTQENNETKQIWFNPTIRWSVAASLILLVGAFFLLAGNQTIRAEYGQHQLAKLPDGSEVRLNSGSVLKYSKLKWMLSRKVELEGEAYFKVTEGEKFEVVTAKGSVAVLGTRFNVRARGERMDVACYSGRVLVTSGDIIQDLNPNTSISIVNDKVLDVKIGQVATEPAWMNGITRLQNVPLSEVFEAMERTLNLQIENQEPSIDTIRFTGAFPNNPELALKLVLEPLNISYSFEANRRKLTITGRNE